MSKRYTSNSHYRETFWEICVVPVNELNWLIVAVILFTSSVLSGTVVAELKPNGLHHQPWIKVQNEFSIEESLAEARAANKDLVILFEQRGCPYCERLHNENFSYSDVTDYMNKYFTFMQIDLRGNRKVKLLDGKTVSEQEFSRTLAVTNTPTTLFIKQDGKERFRMPGYIEAAFYKAGFQYVVESGPESGVGFVPWVKALIKRSRKK